MEFALRWYLFTQTVPNSMITSRAVQFAATLALLSSCSRAGGGPSAQTTSSPPHNYDSVVSITGTNVSERFNPPQGFTRAPASAGSFAAFLRNCPIYPHGRLVRLYDGSEKRRQDVHAAVLHFDVGTRDLQQCADAVMRLRAEYLFAAGRPADIAFNFTSGFRAGFDRWMRGERVSVKGGTARWAGGGTPDQSHTALRGYLDVVYSYAGTLSLEKELQLVPLSALQAGDVFIRGGSPGHAVIVMDVAQNAAGKQVFLLAQSYMPAQDIHILHNPARDDRSPWYTLDPTAATIETPEWDFAAGELRRFAEE